jgi:hypothetical protein
MTNIDRRRFLASIATTATCTPAVLSGSAPANSGERPHLWLIAQQRRTTTSAVAVDFWSKPLCSISYADYLPSEIVRGVLWYDGFSPQKSLSELLEYADSVHREDNFAWVDEPRAFTAHFEGVETLSSTLLPLIVGNQSASARFRTALLALDSISAATGEPEWNKIIPRLESSYDRIIGHCHLEQRGLLHHQWLAALDESYFQQTICAAASQCDAVIFTSPSLIETDQGLSASASTESLVGELMQRLGNVLLDENALEHIVSATETKRSRLFALGSVTLYPPADTFARSLFPTLYRQRDLVSGCFGELMSDEPSFLIATRANNLLAKLASDLIIGSELSFLKLANSSDYVRGPSPIEPLFLLTLWQFDANLG